MISKLVESITRPFLEDMDVETIDKVDDCVELSEQDKAYQLTSVLENYGIEPIKKLAKAVSIPMTIGFINTKPDVLDMIQALMNTKPLETSQEYTSWESRSKDMANKIGYELVDYLDGEDKITNPSANISLSDDDTFVDIRGEICEDFSTRYKIRSMVIESLKKKA